MEINNLNQIFKIILQNKKMKYKQKNSNKNFKMKMIIHQMLKQLYQMIILK